MAVRPGILSFAVGLPASELFPVEALARAHAALLPSDPEALQYGVPYVGLKAEIVKLMALRGVDCRPEQVFLTSGAQQAMDLLARLLLDPGGQVLLEETVYDGMQGAVRRLQPEILTVPTDMETGLDVDAVERYLTSGAAPAFLYAIPAGHNPLGATMTIGKRLHLVELARRFRVPIVEDDAYGFLRYDESPAPALRSLDERWVLYVGSFSKILAPALRAGWTVVPEELIPKLSALKHAADLDTPSFSHRVIAAYLSTGELPGQLERIRAEYRRRRDAMLAALEAHFPAEARWNHPRAGMFVWVELPRGLNAASMLRSAIEEERIAFSPGQTFATTGSHANHCMRLAFTNCPPERIEDGIRRLARIVNEALATMSARR
ncbi:MAG: PLP-dependent aminotransferase family protein [Acidobacteriota bacterium]|nr:PLP-dependent aminotransferase family protein [Acidobacteriota bacterium]